MKIPQLIKKCVTNYLLMLLIYSFFPLTLSCPLNKEVTKTHLIVREKKSFFLIPSNAHFRREKKNNRWKQTEANIEAANIFHLVNN